MTHTIQNKLCGSNSPTLVLAQVILLLVAVALPVAQWTVSAQQQWDSDLQQMRLQKLWLNRALNILEDHPQIVQEVGAGTKTIDSMTLSLIEAIKRQARTDDLDLTQLTVAQSDGQKDPNAVANTGFHSMRVDFAVNVDKAATLLPLIDALKEASGWRPIEIRGCSIVRVSSAPVNLHAACTVDVYFFPEVDQ